MRELRRRRWHTPVGERCEITSKLVPVSVLSGQNGTTGQAKQQDRGDLCTASPRAREDDGDDRGQCLQDAGVAQEIDEPCSDDPTNERRSCTERTQCMNDVSLRSLPHNVSDLDVDILLACSLWSLLCIFH